MQETVFSARVRQATGKNENRRLRNSGEIPAIIYGKHREALNLAFHPKAMVQYLQKGANPHQIFTIEIEESGKKQEHKVLLKDIQRNAMTDSWTHVDFLEVRMDETIVVAVTINYVGKAKGIISGGLVDVIRREIEVSCLPTNMPDHIDVDISDLDLGDAIHISDIKIPEGVKVLDGDHLTLVTCSAPEEEKVEAVSEDAAMEAAAAAADAAKAEKSEEGGDKK